eukprot:364833-Chlamydomonas_euryale.AAC.17
MTYSRRMRGCVGLIRGRSCACALGWRPLLSPWNFQACRWSLTSLKMTHILGALALLVMVAHASAQYASSTQVGTCDLSADGVPSGCL